MTTTTHTQTALLVAAVETLNAQISAAKKAGVPVPGIGAEIAPGIKLRDLKSWHKEFKAKQASASVPATAAASVKPAAAAKAPAAEVAEFTTKELKGAELLIGRAKETIKSVVKAPEGDRVAITESGVRIPVANLERNNRGNLRVKLGMEPGKAPAAKTAAAAPAPKAASAKTAPAAAELKSGEIREAGVILVGRAKETVKRITKVGDERFVLTVEGGLRIAVAHLERNNRGNIRVIESEVAAYLSEKAPASAAPAPAAKTAAPKATGKKPAAVEQEELPEEAPAANGGRVYPIRVLDIKHSTQLTGAEYDRNTGTLFVTLKDAAVWAYEGVKLSEVRAFEQAALPWKHFSAHIANDKKGKMVKNHKAAPAAAKAEPKTAVAKAAANAPANASNEISTTALRADGFMDGRKHETVQSINRVKDTGQRIVVTASGKRIPLEAIILAKGKFRVSDLALISGAVNPAKAKPAVAAPTTKGTENTRKNGKAQKLDFSAAEKAAAKPAAKVTSEKPSRAQVKEAGVRVVKGSKEKLVDVIRIVNRDTGLTAVTSNKGALKYDLIVSFDGQPTYTGKITAEEFRAL